MRYILNNEGYIYDVSFGAIIECSLGTCTEYKGKVPDGYSTIEDWYAGEIERLNSWKIVDGNLVFDTARDYRLKILHEKECFDNGYVTRKELGIKNTDETSPYANLFPDLDGMAGDITWVDEEFGKVGNFSVSEVRLRNDNDSAITGLIELEFIGSNFLPNTATDSSNNGIEYIQNIDKTINIKGTATERSVLNLAGTDTSIKNILTFKGGYLVGSEQGNYIQPYEYTLYGLHEALSLEFYHYDGTDRTLIGVYKNNDIITFDKDTNVTQVVLVIEKGITIDTTIKPMLALIGIEHPVLPMTKYTGDGEKNGWYYVDGVSTQATRSGYNCYINSSNLTQGASNVSDAMETLLNYEGYDKVIHIKQAVAYATLLNNILNDYYIANVVAGSSITCMWLMKIPSGITPTVYVTNNTTTYYTSLTKYKEAGNGWAYYYATYTFKDTATSFTLLPHFKTEISGEVYVAKMQVTIGSEIKDFEEYGASPSPEYPSEIINLYSAGTYNTILNGKVYEFTIPEDLRSVPSGVADRLWFDIEGTSPIEIDKKIGNVVLNGSEDWVLQETLSNGKVVFRQMTLFLDSAGINANGLSNYLPYDKTVYDTNDKIGFYFNSSKYLNFIIWSTTASTVNDFKTWLSTNNVEVYYELETATHSEITSYSHSKSIEYEEYKNNSTLIDLQENELTFEDEIIIRDNQVMLVKLGAMLGVEDQYEYIFLGDVSMPRTYTPQTYVYCHQRVRVEGFKYRDSRNIDVNKISFGGSIIIPNIETDNLIVNGSEINEDRIKELIDNSNCYRDGDVFIRKKDMYLGAYVSDSNTTIYTTLFLPKRLDKIKTLTINRFNFTIRGISGYLQSTIEHTDFDGTITANIASDNAISFLIKKNSAFDVTNNTPAAVQINGLEIVFGEAGEDTSGDENSIVEVNKSTTITGSTSISNLWTFKTVVKETKINKTDKTSTLTVTNYIGRKTSAGSSYFKGTLTNKFECNGQTYQDTFYKDSGTVSAGGWCKLGSHEFTVTHTQEPMTINVKGSMSTSAFNPNSASASGTVTLTEI